MTTTSEIEAVVKATVALVAEQLRAKWGSLQDCCTDANELIYAALLTGVELPNEIYHPSLERIQGTVNVAGELMPHEWLRIDGVDYDATAEQFGLAGVTADYDGEVIDW